MNVGIGIKGLDIVQCREINKLCHGARKLSLLNGQLCCRIHNKQFSMPSDYNNGGRVIITSALCLQLSEEE